MKPAFTGTEFSKLLVMARRKGDDWYISAVMALPIARRPTLDLDFIGNGEYQAVIRGYIRKPRIVREQRQVSSKDRWRWR